MQVAKHKSTILWPASLAVAFVFVVGSASPEASHCLTACGPFAVEPCSVSSHTEGVHALAQDSGSPAESGDHADDSACAGPTCLCHQHLDAPTDLVRPTGASGIPWALRPPALPDLGVVREIHHVPIPVA